MFSASSSSLPRFRALPSHHPRASSNGNMARKRVCEANDLDAKKEAAVLMQCAYRSRRAWREKTRLRDACLERERLAISAAGGSPSRLSPPGTPSCSLPAATSSGAEAAIKSPAPPGGSQTGCSQTGRVSSSSFSISGAGTNPVAPSRTSSDTALSLASFNFGGDAWKSGVLWQGAKEAAKRQKDFLKHIADFSRSREENTPSMLVVEPVVTATTDNQDDLFADGDSGDDEEEEQEDWDIDISEAPAAGGDANEDEQEQEGSDGLPPKCLVSNCSPEEVAAMAKLSTMAFREHLTRAYSTQAKGQKSGISSWMKEDRAAMAQRLCLRHEGLTKAAKADQFVEC